MSSDSSSTDPLQLNRRAWDGLARAGDEYFHAASAEQIGEARSGNVRVRVTPQKMVPLEWLEPLKDRTVLCLAGGGGQQGPLLAAAGAQVTVFDLSEAQLQRDQQVAQREGLKLSTVCGDMANLESFVDDQFDLILNPCSVCYCPQTAPIWAEAFRVLKPGGYLIAGLINPVYYLFDAVKMDRGALVARHRIPYSDFDLSTEERERIWGVNRPAEYGHSLTELIGGQLEAGFQLTAVYEDGWGMNDKLSSMIATFLATRAVKPPSR
jgi:SAM-dependent methyltransferase